MKLPFIEAGEIVTTHGVRGEVKLLTWLDAPEDLLGVKRCRIGGVDYKMESVRVQKTCNLIKLSGVDTMEDAQKGLNPVSSQGFAEIQSVEARSMAKAGQIR